MLSTNTHRNGGGGNDEILLSRSSHHSSWHYKDTDAVPKHLGKMHAERFRSDFPAPAGPSRPKLAPVTRNAGAISESLSREPSGKD